MTKPTLRLALDAGPATPELAAAHGVRGVPIHGGDLLERGVAATLAPLRERGLDPCQVGAMDFNPLRADAAAHARLDRLIGLAAEAGCPWIAITGGNYHAAAFAATDPRNFTTAALDAVAEALGPHARAAEARGVGLTIEPYLKGVVGTPERCAAIVARVGSPALRVTFDPTSLYDFAALADPPPFVARMGAALAAGVGLVHVKEVALAEGFHLHAGLVPLGRGRTDWAELLRIVAPLSPATSWVVLEHVSPDDVARSLELLRAAATKAEVTLA